MRKFIFVCFALMLLIQVEAAKLKNEKDIASEKGVENKENINKEDNNKQSNENNKIDQASNNELDLKNEEKKNE